MDILRHLSKDIGKHGLLDSNTEADTEIWRQTLLKRRHELLKTDR